MVFHFTSCNVSDDSENDSSERICTQPTIKYRNSSDFEIHRIIAHREENLEKKESYLPSFSHEDKLMKDEVTEEYRFGNVDEKCRSAFCCEEQRAESFYITFWRNLYISAKENPEITISTSRKVSFYYDKNYTIHILNEDFYIED